MSEEIQNIEEEIPSNNKNKELIKSLSKLFLPALGVSASLFYLFGIPWIPSFLGLFSIQIMANLIWDWILHKRIEVKKVNEIINEYVSALETEQKQYEDAKEEYQSLDYKKYIVPLMCRGCGKENNVEMDLSNTEFRCKYCSKSNAIYINFTVASITDPVDVNNFITKAFDNV